MLNIEPDILLLDEPTNHLDLRNRKSLLRMLQNYSRTLIVATHDIELLENCFDTLWHIENGNIHIFKGNYKDYIREIQIKRNAIQSDLNNLSRQKKDIHENLMKEQERAKKSNLRGEKSIEERKWPTIVSDSKARRAVETSGKKKRAIKGKREELTEKLLQLRVPEILKPKFSLSVPIVSNRTLIFISEGTVGYGKIMILKEININISTTDRVAIIGDNGSGKSSFIKAILNAPEITNSGNWYMPKVEDIGYLDQHYNMLSSDETVFESIKKLVPKWDTIEIRRHLNDFLFRKNEEVNTLVNNLSGGEKARLSLAQIAAKIPKLLILDEITNNVDLETRQHIIKVLNEYPRALIVISHDESFLDEINIDGRYYIKNGRIHNT